MKTKRLATVLIMLSVCYSGCATTSSFRVSETQIEELKSITSISIHKFMCQDPIVATAIQSMIIEELLNLPIRVVKSGDADAIIEGTITFSSDAVTSSGAYLGANANYASGAAVSSGTAGVYVSGINAQIIKDGQILASATFTQVRTHDWIPDPAEVMGRKIGERIRRVLTGEKPERRKRRTSTGGYR